MRSEEKGWMQIGQSRKWLRRENTSIEEAITGEEDTTIEEEEDTEEISAEEEIEEADTKGQEGKCPVMRKATIEADEEGTGGEMMETTRVAGTSGKDMTD